MKQVTAYQALGGTLHSDKAGAAMASILHLGKTENNDLRGQSISEAEVAFIIQHRKKIAQILTDIDAPDAQPDCGCRGGSK
ncbi:hypothetical protein [Leisingera daeponensis]|uniref:hypothetical protein n=1 Tax=Leisingera daeponensis TaxID=405746 RepID=UPI001C968BA1|nr:hypothetical protein [Leisingera daeponensis]MBY6055365.1 hypothetical protein [Leisingera daeponensis]